MRLLAAVALVACSSPAPAPRPPVAASAPTDAAVQVAAPAASQDEKLAAIQKAMNELDEAAQGCWAAAATDRFDIAGELTFMVAITPASASVTVVTDTVRNAKLSTCVGGLLGAYRWAPPLHGETIQLPFSFRAPDGQSVIDRRLVEWHGQANISVAVLLDENNSGNPAASILEVAIAPKSTTQMRVADRAEVWYFAGDAEVKSRVGKDKQMDVQVKAGDMLYVPKGAAREVIARQPDMHAVVALVPGGREGTARAGALPTTTGASGASLPVVLAGTTFGPATIFLEPAVVKTTPVAASILEIAAGGRVAEHVHTGETELLYVLEGAGAMTIAGQDIAVTASSVIQIPPNTKHSFVADTKVRSVQLYTPPGPEQRFKRKP